MPPIDKKSLYEVDKRVGVTMARLTPKRALIGLAIFVLICLLIALPDVPENLSIEKAKASAIANQQNCASMAEMDRLYGNAPYTCGSN